MTEENLELKQTSEAPTEEKDLNEEQADPDVQEEESIDYAAELAKVKEDRDNYKKGMLSAKDENKKLKEGGDPDNEEVKELRNELDSFRKDLTKNTFGEVLANVSDNIDEQELIKHHYNNSLKKTGFSKEAIANDLRTAKLLANRKKLEKENEELKTTIINKNGISNSSLGTNRSRKTVDNTKLTPAEEKIFNRVNSKRVARGEKPMTKKEILTNN